MRVRVKLFAILRDQTGVSDVDLKLAASATVADAFVLLRERYPAMTGTFESIAYAVNLEYVPRDHRLADGDELALIPPVSGG